MTTREFLQSLQPTPDALLAFRTEAGRVPGGYHVTEIKATTVRAMNCGGRATDWHETVVQVQPPAGSSDEAPMSVAKFLAIYERVTARLPIEDDAYLRIETGEPGAPAIPYLADAVNVADGVVEVRLVAPAVACKGNDATVGDLPVARTPSREPDVLHTADVACC
ncbi:MAG: DUF6428 family protein [Trueperaceae bacterium]